MVISYRDLFPNHAATLMPFIDLCRQKKKFFWENEQEQAFIKIKDLMAPDTRPTYLQFDKPLFIFCTPMQVKSRLMELSPKKISLSGSSARSSLTPNAAILSHSRSC
jgi:hypothetical protein